MFFRTKCFLLFISLIFSTYSFSDLRHWIEGKTIHELLKTQEMTVTDYGKVSVNPKIDLFLNKRGKTNCFTKTEYKHKLSGKIFFSYHTTEDICDGGNSIGWVENENHDIIYEISDSFLYVRGHSYNDIEWIVEKEEGINSSLRKNIQGSILGTSDDQLGHFMTVMAEIRQSLSSDSLSQDSKQGTLPKHASKMNEPLFNNTTEFKSDVYNEMMSLVLSDGNFKFFPRCIQSFIKASLVSSDQTSIEVGSSSFWTSKVGLKLLSIGIDTRFKHPMYVLNHLYNKLNKDAEWKDPELINIKKLQMRNHVISSAIDSIGTPKGGIAPLDPPSSDITFKSLRAY